MLCLCDADRFIWNGMAGKKSPFLASILKVSGYDEYRIQDVTEKREWWYLLIA
jgi:hypothetical protein